MPRPGSHRAVSEAELDARSAQRGPCASPTAPLCQGLQGPEKWTNSLWESETAQNRKAQDKPV